MEYQALRPAIYSTLGCEDLLALAMDADAMLVTPFDRLDAAFFRKVSASVKVMATYSAGVDHIDMPAAEARSIVSGSTPGANASATAAIAMLLMLGARS
jgi:lactate dehydrogenase-like 2-hydroxyacid dehydrogenase